MTLRTQTEIPTVAEVIGELNRTLRSHGDGWVEGEVTRWIISPRRHAFFTLQDEDAEIECRIWADEVPPKEQHPAAGDRVQVHYTRPEIWPAKGKFQLSVDEVQPTGEGVLLRRVAETLRKLEADGLTDPARHPALPRFPRRVGLISGAESDGLADVATALRERFPPVRIAHCPASVEGARAVPSIIDALGQLSQEPEVDVIILARGGGSVSALFPFSDERLCRAIFACGVPVVTSIGHTKQRPNCDHVAAGAAHVPAKAAELVVPSAADLSEEIARIEALLDGVPGLLSSRREEIAAIGIDVRTRMARFREGIEATVKMIGLKADSFYAGRRQQVEACLAALANARSRALPRERIVSLVERIEAQPQRLRHDLDNYRRAIGRHERQTRQHVSRRLAGDRDRVSSSIGDLTRAGARRLQTEGQNVRHQRDLIEARDFRRRGWMLGARADGQPVASATELKAGDRIALQIHDGSATTTIDDVNVDDQEEKSDD